MLLFDYPETFFFHELDQAWSLFLPIVGRQDNYEAITSTLIWVLSNVGKVIHNTMLFLFDYDGISWCHSFLRLIDAVLQRLQLFIKEPE